MQSDDLPAAGKASAECFDHFPPRQPYAESGLALAEALSTEPRHPFLYYFPQLAENGFSLFYTKVWKNVKGLPKFYSRNRTCGAADY